MAYDSDHKTSADLQREIDQQRNRLEDRIDAIQEKLSPGQLVDEVLAYTKGGGGEIVSNLQRQITANPLPVALLGVSLAWLIAKPQSNASSYSSYDRSWDNSINRNRGYGAGDDYTDDSYDYDDVDYPIATISGSSLSHTGHSTDDKGNRLAHFADESGKKWQAATDSLGRRAGHFRDDAGNTYKGFADAAGNRISSIKDQAGNALDEASGWASDAWAAARRKLHDAQQAIGSGAGSARHQAQRAGANVQQGAGQLSDTIVHQFRDQPLVAGALAFALGAALGAAIPRTEQENAVLGEASDKVKAKVGEQASQLYEQGRDKASELYETATSKVNEVYSQTKEGLADATNTSGTANTSGNA